MSNPKEIVSKTLIERIAREEISIGRTRNKNNK